jgi:hypothetical protein
MAYVVEARPRRGVACAGEQTVVARRCGSRALQRRKSPPADFAFQGLLGTLSPVLGVVMAPAFKKLGDEAEKGMRDALERL